MVGAAVPKDLDEKEPAYRRGDMVAYAALGKKAGSVYGKAFGKHQ